MIKKLMVLSVFVSTFINVNISAKPNADELESRLNANVLKNLVKKSDTIVQAKLMDKEGVWTKYGVVTKNVFTVLRDLSEGSKKRQSGELVEVITPGGVAYHPKLQTLVKTSVSHAPNIEAVDEVIIFAKASTSGELILTDNKFGIWEIVFNENEMTKILPDVSVMVASNNLAKERAMKTTAEGLISNDYSENSVSIHEKKLSLNEAVQLIRDLKKQPRSNLNDIKIQRDEVIILEGKIE
ncbi:MAG: hypothetical protein HWE27_00185 [Gammaproteobacteria bacterium]|nr:hypothetical protein [Gammaproteobacteria bacterium]